MTRDASIEERSSAGARALEEVQNCTQRANAAVKIAACYAQRVLQMTAPRGGSGTAASSAQPSMMPERLNIYFSECAARNARLEHLHAVLENLRGALREWLSAASPDETPPLKGPVYREDGTISLFGSAKRHSWSTKTFLEQCTLTHKLCTQIEADNAESARLLSGLNT